VENPEDRWHSVGLDKMLPLESRWGIYERYFDAKEEPSGGIL
jgi:hypothetical protein